MCRSINILFRIQSRDRILHIVEHLPFIRFTKLQNKRFFVRIYGSAVDKLFYRVEAGMRHHHDKGNFSRSAAFPTKEKRV